MEPCLSVPIAIVYLFGGNATVKTIAAMVQMSWPVLVVAVLVVLVEAQPIAQQILLRTWFTLAAKIISNAITVCYKIKKCQINYSIYLFFKLCGVQVIVFGNLGFAMVNLIAPKQKMKRIATVLKVERRAEQAVDRRINAPSIVASCQLGVCLSRPSAMDTRIAQTIQTKKDVAD